MTQPPERVDTFELLRSRPDDPPNIRWLRFAVVGMGVILILGLATMVARIVYLTTRPAVAVSVTPDAKQTNAQGTATIASDMALALPLGAKVRTQSLSGNRLSVHYDGPGGEGIVILDLETGRTISQVRIQSSK
jgi:hypothetical protein